MKNFSEKVADKKRKIKVEDRLYGREVRINGLNDFIVSLYKNKDKSNLIWYCHGSTYQIVNVIHQVFGEKSGWLKVTQGDGERLIDTLLNTLETLGHEVAYETPGGV